ncbi:MAG: hypothetical protein HDQ92_06520 [Desulfovibrio sp.]|nr:hypothetical protein [Desulfovibrio sp.]
MSKLPQSLLLAAVLLAAATIPDASSTEAAPPRAAQSSKILDETDGHDLSPEREGRYTRSVIRWLETLPARQRQQARKILQEAHPGVHVLRVRIRETKARLERLAFDSDTPTDTLPRLGLELQMLRNRLRKRLQEITDQLRTEVGVPMGSIAEEGYWLNPGSDEAPARTGTPVSAPAGR